MNTAATDYAWARALGPTHDFGPMPARVLLNYGQTLVAYGDAERGLAVIEETQALIPKQTQDWKVPFTAARADALISLDRLDEAGAAIDSAESMLSPSGDPRVAQNVYRIRRRLWLAMGKADEALKDFHARPPLAGETATAGTMLRRQAEEATLLLAAGQNAAARTHAEDALAAIDRSSQRRFSRDVEAQMTAVTGVSLLREAASPKRCRCCSRR